MHMGDRSATDLQRGADGALSRSVANSADPNAAPGSRKSLRRNGLRVDDGLWDTHYGTIASVAASARMSFSAQRHQRAGAAPISST